MPLTITPQPGNNLGQTRDLISGNFSLIENAFVVDHVDYGLMPNQGKHNQVTFPTHTGTIPANGAPVNTEIYLFNQTSPITNTDGDVWLQRGSGTPYPITASSVVVGGGTVAGWTYLPSGLIMKFGLITIAAGGTVTYPTGAGIPVFSAVHSVQVTPMTNNIFASITLSAPTFFTVGFSAAINSPIYYMVMGE